MKFTKENIKDTVPNICGIYVIKNCVNGKCYVGQSIYLQKRLLTHVNPKTWNKVKDRMIIYKALLKYGLDDFEFEILYANDSTDYANVKPILDELEKKYISEYNSKENGYNQTIGGDAGVTGLKMTKGQCEHQREARMKIVNNWEHEVRAYDVINQHMYFAVSYRAMGEKLGIPLSGQCVINLLIAERYIIARNGKELTEKCNKYFEQRNALKIGNRRKNNGIFVEKLNPQEFVEYRKNHTIKECEEHFQMCRKSIQNYQDKYCPELKGKDKPKFDFYIRNIKTCFIYHVTNLTNAEKELKEYGYSISRNSLARLAKNEIEKSCNFKLYNVNAKC